MALVLSRRNGAPLGGALFVSNPRNRKNRRNAAKKRRTAAKRRAAPKRRNMAHAKRSTAAKKAAATRRRNALKRSRAAKKGAATRRRNARKGIRTGLARKTVRSARSKMRKAARLVAPKRRRNGMHKNRRNTVAVRVNRRNRRNRRNASYIKLSNRRNRRNSAATVASFKLSGIAQKVYTPISRLLKKIPYVGKPIAAALPTGVYFLAGAAAHNYIARPLVSMAYSYVPMAVQSAVAPVARFIAPAQSFLTGVLVAALLQHKRIPLKPATKKQLAVALIGSGAVMDAFRAYGGDYSGAMTLPGYGNAMTIPGYGNAMTIPGYGAIGMDLGDGGAYDVVPMGALAAEYNGASAADAGACPADLSVEEGEAALSGPGYWRKYFGPPPMHAASTSMHSNLVGRPGHRWGWLIKMIGFERFSKLASISPDARVQLLANLKAQAIQMADAQIAQAATPSVPDTGALAMDMNGVLYAGAI
jgi:hypothetical protein